MSDFLKFKTKRINRIEYLSLGLLMQTVLMAVIFITILIGRSSTLLVGLLFIFTVMWYIFTIVYGILLGIKRLHDLDRSGWLILLMLIPLFNIGWSFYMLCVSGSKGENRFGEQPQPAALSHKITLFVCLFIFIASIVGISVVGNMIQPTNKAASIHKPDWKTYATKNLTIKFPGKYEVTKKNIAKGVTLTNISHVNYVDEVKLDAGIINYKQSNNYYKKAVDDSLTAMPENTVKLALGIKADNQDIKVALDESMQKYDLPCRKLYAIIKFHNNTYYLKSMIYLDKPHYKYYLLRVYYPQNDLQNNNDKIAKQFLDSFKLLSH